VLYHSQYLNGLRWKRPERNNNKFLIKYRNHFFTNIFSLQLNISFSKYRKAHANNKYYYRQGLSVSILTVSPEKKVNDADIGPVGPVNAIKYKDRAKNNQYRLVHHGILEEENHVNPHP